VSSFRIRLESDEFQLVINICLNRLALERWLAKTRSLALESKSQAG